MVQASTNIGSHMAAAGVRNNVATKVDNYLPSHAIT